MTQTTEPLKCPNCQADIVWHQDPMPHVQPIANVKSSVLQNGFCETRCVVFVHTRLRENREKATQPVVLPGGLNGMTCWWQRPQVEGM